MSIMQKRNLIKLSFGHAITDISGGALPIMLAFLQPVFSLTQLQVGMAVTAFSITSSIIQPAFGIYSDRYRLPWLMPAGCLLAGVGMWLTGLAPNFYTLLLAILLSGLGVAAFHPEGSKYARYSSGHNKVSGMAIFSVGGNVGVAAGPVLAALFYGLAQLKGTAGFLVLCAAMAVILYLSLPHFEASRVTVDPGGPGAGSGKERAGLSLSWRVAIPLVLVLLIVTFRSWVSIGLLTFVPQYYIHHLNRSEIYATAINSLVLAAGAAGTLIGGPIADRLGMKSVIIGSMALQIPLLYMFLHLDGVWAIISITLAGLVLVSTFAVTLVYGQELLPGRVGLASGLIIGFGVGMGGVGAPLIGYIADQWGFVAAFNALIALPLLSLILAFFLPGDVSSVRGKVFDGARI